MIKILCTRDDMDRKQFLLIYFNASISKAENFKTSQFGKN